MACFPTASDPTSFLLIERSASAGTVTTSAAELLMANESGVVDETVTVLVTLG